MARLGHVGEQGFTSLSWQYNDHSVFVLKNDLYTSDDFLHANLSLWCEDCDLGTHIAGKIRVAPNSETCAECACLARLVARATFVVEPCSS